MRIVLLLGAGFANAAGSPLAAQLFDEAPIGGSHDRDNQVAFVLSAWRDWQQAHPGQGAEAFITDVFRNSALLPGTGLLWRALQTFLALRISAAFVRWSFPDGKANRSSDNFMNARVGPAHELWWDTFFHYYGFDRQLTVLTTNWDIWIERALRPRPRPRRRRPGFHYERGPERLAEAPRFPSRWYQGTDFGKDTTVDGHVTLLKLHGSLSWALKNGQLEKYGDLRPAFRGDAAIIPPIEEKDFAEWLRPVWACAQSALERAEKVIVVGYSFPDYDPQMRHLFQRSLGTKEIAIHVFDPSANSVAGRISSFLPSVSVIEHAGIPEGCDDLSHVVTGPQDRQQRDTQDGLASLPGGCIYG